MLSWDACILYLVFRKLFSEKAMLSGFLKRLCGKQNRFVVLLFVPSVLQMVFVPMTLAASTSDIPRTSDGHPDFGGVWYYGSATPFERPRALGNKRTFNATEGVVIVDGLRKSDDVRRQPSNPNREAPPGGVEIGQEADDNFSTLRTNLTFIDGAFRTSLVISPENGRLPYRRNGRDIFDEWSLAGIDEYAGAESRPASERCLSVVGPMAPMIGWLYNANMRILQTPGYVVLKGEMLPPRILATRNVPLSVGAAQWMGESTTHWEGDVLVVNTVNFRPEISWFQLKSSRLLQVTEYFRLANKDSIVYRYVVTDPEIYSAPVTVEMVMQRRPAGERLFEYACHEANYSLPAILRGARLSEAVQGG